jgi:aryl-phospho-beta-D-glucosidase BglC (GH1 family)
MHKISFTLVLAALSVGFAFAGIATDNGRLFRDGNKIVSEKSNGQPVQLKGPSMQWSVEGWGSDKFFRTETVDALVKGWDAQILRVPVGISVPGQFDTGFDNEDHRANVWARAKTVIDQALSHDIYVIVDWHSHTAHLGTEPDLAVEFFTSEDYAGQYGNNPNVIFEIYNEPLDTVAWATVKTYSDKVIGAIRTAGFNNLILVGNPYWDTTPDIAAADPPTDAQDNFAFVFHFYTTNNQLDKVRYLKAGDKTKYPEAKDRTYQGSIEATLELGYPVFVSEFGTNAADEKSKPDLPKTDKWVEFMNANFLSGCAWGVTAGGTIWGANELDYWTLWGNPFHFDIAKQENWTDPWRMTAHGRWIYKWLTDKDTTNAGADAWPTYTGASSPLTGEWYSFVDAEKISEIATLDTTINDVDVLKISYTVGKDTSTNNPYVAAGIPVTGIEDCKYGLSYTYAGAEHYLRMEQSDLGEATNNWDFHRSYKPTPYSESWTVVNLPWGFFWQAGWGEEVARDYTLITNLAWEIEREFAKGKREVGELYIKDVKCLEEEEAIVASATPDPDPDSEFAVEKPVVPILQADLNAPHSSVLASVYDIRGNFVGVSQGLSATLKDLVPGVYIVHQGSQTNKIVVK